MTERLNEPAYQQVTDTDHTHGFQRERQQANPRAAARLDQFVSGTVEIHLKHLYPITAFVYT